MRDTKYLHNDKWLPIIYFILGFLLLQLLDVFELELVSFIAKNIFLFFFLFYNIKRYRKSTPQNWLLNPAVLASIMTFFLGFCLTNFVYFIPGSEDEKQMYRLLGSEPLIYFNKGMNAIIMAAIAMWIGYNSKLGIKLYHLILRFPINFKQYFRSSFVPDLKIIYLFFALAIAARLYAIYLGIYGFSQSPEKVSASIGISYILLSITDLTSLLLLVVSFVYFRNPKNFNYKFTFIIILIIEIGFGMLSGMKSAVVMPIILSFITYYLVNNKIHKGFIITAFGLIIIAYIIIEPFRQIRMRDASFQSTPGYIANTMVDAYFLNKSRKVVYGTDDILTSILSRNAYLLPASKSIQFEDERGLGPADPDFLEKIYTLPLQAFIPRLFWADKPVEDFARWYSVNVWGGTATTSVAMTPIGFLYFAGGLVFIILGFFLIGILQKTLWQFYLAGGGQLLIFLAMLNTVVLIDSSFNGMIVYWLRYIPIFILLQSFILKRTNPQIRGQVVYPVLYERL